MLGGITDGDARGRRNWAAWQSSFVKAATSQAILGQAPMESFRLTARVVNPTTLESWPDSVCTRVPGKSPVPRHWS